jgi:hypothetical protein
VVPSSNATPKNDDVVEVLYDELHTSILPAVTEEAFADTNLLTANNFTFYDHESLVDEMETLERNLYTASKFLAYLHYKNYLTSINLYTLGIQPVSYIDILDSYRDDFEENVSSTELLYQDKSEDATATDYDVRTTNFLKLRAPSADSIAMFKALQKVFRMRFDEGRSNLHFSDLSNSMVKYPSLSEAGVPFRKLLGKNTESFFSAISYKNSLSSYYSDLTPLFNTLSTYLTTVPFLLSMRSDTVKYLWFDHQSR